MSSRDADAAQERLLRLLAERGRSGSPARRIELDAEIRSVGAELGLAPDELDALPPQLIETVRRPPDLMGPFRIYRRARDVMPFLIGLMLVPIGAGLGEPVIAALGLVLLAVAWVVRSRTRVAVFDIDALGRLDLGRHRTVDWYAVDEVTFGFRYAWATPKSSIHHAASETAVVRIRLRDGRTVRLAQGQLFQTRPPRRPIALADLGRFLRRQATAAGLKVEKLGGGNGRWRAFRPTP